VSTADTRAAIASGLTYLLVAAAFFAAGVGAVGGRAWARPALVSLAWIWLLTGALVVAFLALVVPALPVPPELALVVRAMALGLGGLVGVAAPAALLWMLRGAAPVPSGDATCPQPVLVLATALAATSVLALPTIVRPVVPVLHVVLTGLPAAALTLVVAALCAWLARGVYRRERRALAGTAALFAASGASLVVTALTIDASEIWTALGAGAEEADWLAAASLSRSAAVACAVLATVASLAWLAALRRHFPPAQIR